MFLDSTKGVAESQRWKMICSNATYASPDGLHWTKLPWTTVAEDDTKPTTYHSPALQKCIVMV